jgi:flagellar biosynthesis/type III secretory pathway M-ring protein FliF/YscJ
VRFRFDIPPENLIISDHTGRSLHDPAASQEEHSSAGLIAQAAQYDRELAAKANEALSLAFGPHMAYLTVVSDWDFDQSTTIEELVDPSRRAAVTEELTSTKTTGEGAGSATGGPTGVASNVDQPPAAAAPAASESSSKDERKVFETSQTTMHRVHRTPMLRRLSVSLFLDESLAERSAEVEALAKSVVGFVQNEKRQDQLASLVAPLGTVNAPAEEKPDEGGGLSPTLTLLLERGVEIAAALFFLLILAKSLRAPKAASERALVPQHPADPDLELLARAQVEELVRTDPDRVSAILSRWAEQESLAESKP